LSLPPADAPAAYRLALALEEDGFTDLARKAHERVVAADPDHAAARRALGFEKVDGRWLSGDDLLRAKGFVRVGARWVLAQEAPKVDDVLPRIRRAAVGFQSDRSEDRVRAAEEIARIGDERGIPVLVGAWARSDARTVGGYFSQARQRSYLHDFDTEVA
jgi:hypothetical protein